MKINAVFFLKSIFICKIKKCWFRFCSKYGSNIFCMKSMLEFMFCCDINHGDIMFCEQNY